VICLAVAPKSLPQVQCNAAECYSTPCWILHATKLFAMPCLIHHATKFFAATCLILKTLLHVLKMMVIESPQLISHTSDVVHAKVNTTGEPTTPSLLITALPSMNDFIAGNSCARDLLQAQRVTLQHIICASVDLDNLHIGNNNVYKHGIRPTVPCPRLSMCCTLCAMPKTPSLTVVPRSLLANPYNPFFATYKGDYAKLFPERVIKHDGKQSHILPVKRAIAKHDTSNKSITMELETFTHVSHVPYFGKHMLIGPTSTQFPAVYGHQDLAEHTALASYPFNPGGYLSRGFVFDPRGFISDPRWFIFSPGGFMQLLNSLQAA